MPSSGEHPPAAETKGALGDQHEQTLSHRAGPSGPRARLARQSAERRLSKEAKTSMGFTSRIAENVWKVTLASKGADETLTR